jgi:thiol:disulfide interchange protein DsbD
MNNMILRTLVLSILLGLGVLGGGHAHAQGSPTPNYVHVNLYATVTAVAPNQPFDVIIEQLIEPEWHTYWKNPGDSGLALSAAWTLPNGASASDLHHPIPRRIPFGPLLNFGYDNRALWTATITPPASLTGDRFDLAVRLDWLVCKDICLPEGDTYRLSLPVVADAPAPLNIAIDDLVRDVKVTHPRPVSWPATYDVHDQTWNLTLTPGDQTRSLLAGGARLEFFPEAWGVIDNPSEQVVTTTEGNEIIFSIKRGDRSLADVQAFDGVVVVESDDGTRQGYALTVAPSATLATTPKDNAPEVPGGLTDQAQALKVDAVKPQTQTVTIPGLLAALALAIMGGLILNLMPCVFPVLSLKVLSLAALSGAEQKLMRRHGLAYTAGVVAMFLLVGGILATIQHAGAAVGWGFQLQAPVVVAGLIVLFTLLGLNLMGWFEIDFNSLIPARFHRLDDTHSVRGSFATGVLATIVATPCTAPFMGAALGFALTQSTFMALLVFAALGLGLALPFLLVTFVPGLARALPRPGAWMVTMREILAFPMFLTAIWLVWVLAQQTMATGVALAALAVLLVVAWIWLGKQSPARGPIGCWARRLLALVLAVLILVTIGAQHHVPRASAPISGPTHTAFTPAALRAALATDQPVLVNQTAAWCITCKVNERLALETTATRDLLRTENVIYLVGDWTNHNPDITHYLAEFNRQGVPLYVFYPAPTGGARPSPILLPQLLTEGIIRETILNPNQGEKR